MSVSKDKLKRVHEMMTSGAKSSKWTDEQIVDAYLKHGTVAKTAVALGASPASIHQRLWRMRRDAGLKK